MPDSNDEGAASSSQSIAPSSQLELPVQDPNEWLVAADSAVEDGEYDPSDAHCRYAPPHGDDGYLHDAYSPASPSKVKNPLVVREEQDPPLRQMDGPATIDPEGSSLTLIVLPIGIEQPPSDEHKRAAHFKAPEFDQALLDEEQVASRSRSQHLRMFLTRI